MTMQEYITGQIKVLETAINKTIFFLQSPDAIKHRNYRKSAERRLNQLQLKLIEFKSGNLTEDSIYYYNVLYKDVPYDIKRISAL